MATEQMNLELSTSSDLSRFKIPHCGSYITLGDVSRALRGLRRSKRLAEAHELALAAYEIYQQPNWPQIYGPPPKTPAP